MVARVTLPQLCHEAAIVEHGGTHLLLVLVLVRVDAEASTRLVELVLRAVGADVRQHVVDTRIVGRLEHDASLRAVHLVDAERAAAVAALLPHTVSHEEGLVGLASEHTVGTLRGRLGLGAAEVVLTVHGHHFILSQRVVRHGVLVSRVSLEVAHHVR